MKVVVETEAKPHKVRSTVNPEDEVVPERSGGMAACHFAKAVVVCEANLHKVRSTINPEDEVSRNEVEGWLSPV